MMELDTFNYLIHITKFVINFKIYNTILIVLPYKWKSGITDSINHNFARIRIDSYNYLPIKKADFHLCYNTH